MATYRWDAATFQVGLIKVYNMQNADLVRLVCLGASCRQPVPDHRRWPRPAIRSVRIFLEAGGLDG